MLRTFARAPARPVTSQAARQQRSVARVVRIAAPLFTAVLAACASTPTTHELQGEGLGSTWRVKVAGPRPLDIAKLQLGIQHQIDDVANQLSRWTPSSSLSALNAAEDSNWHTLPSQLSKALAYALRLASDTDGAYDPTVTPLVDVWGFGTQGRRYSPPTATEVSAARARVGWAKVELDRERNRVRRPAGIQLDLSSMTHGLAADQVAAYLRSVGATRYLVDVGSELRAAGEAPEGHAWRVAVERPPEELTAAVALASSTGPMPGIAMPPSTRASPQGDASVPMHVVALRDAGIATSGNYRYFFDYDGRRYSHRIDPRTAAPITHSLASVTVIDPECMRADALATALTVLGPDEGLEYARERNIAALFIVRTPKGLEERMTPKFSTYLDDQSTGVNETNAR